MLNDSSNAPAGAQATASHWTGTHLCPCGTGKAYAECCGPHHAGQAAGHPEALMRARYSAYVRKLSDYLLATWHPSTRPPSLDLADRPGLRTHWLGLQVISQRTIDTQRAEVAFIARVRVGGGPAQRLAERSRFLKEDGCWYYVDGEIGPK